MGAAQTALLSLVGALAGAAEPQSVAVLTDPAAPPSGGVDVRPTALTRLGRSHRDGPILDLELLARVLATGPDAVEATERMLVALEGEARYTVEPLPADAGLGFQVRVRVAVRLDEAVGPAVLEPLHLDVRPARVVVGIVLDAGGRGVPDAVVRADPGQPVVADAEGRFRVLAWDAPRQRFVVEVDGSTRTVDTATDTAPVVIRWE